jgi:hypothetical protein
MSRLFTVVAFGLSAFISTTACAGPGISGGGDECENRIKSISQDVHGWIQAGGSKGLSLPEGLTHSAYDTAMQSEIGKAKIRCVGAGDDGYPVEILGTAKTCRFDKSDDSSRITCDYGKFRDLTDEEQYVLVHHEFAGLAGIEPAVGDDSNYEISNQISGYLEDTIVKRLVVNPGVDEKSLCEKDIRAFVAEKFPYDGTTGERQALVSVRIDKVQFIDATGLVDIEVHALYDEDGFSATRIFIDADGIWQDRPGEMSVPAACKNFVVKASYPDPLAE